MWLNKNRHDSFGDRKQSPELTIDNQIGKHIVRFMCDTGSGLNLVPLQLIRTLACESMIMYKPVVLYLVSNTIVTIIGEIQLYLIFQDIPQLINFLVSDQLGMQPIIGRLGLDVMIPNWRVKFFQVPW